MLGTDITISDYTEDTQSNMIVRALYQCLLLMHPPAFRRRFAAEMLGIFDEAAPFTGAGGLLIDAFSSLVRQWILRSGAWKVGIAVLGACLQLTAGGLIWVALGHGERAHDNVPAADAAVMDNLMRLILGAGLALLVMVSAASLWMTSFVRRRALGPGVGR